MKKKVIIVSQNYPSDKNKYAQSFIHPRTKGYIEAGLECAVISFSTSEPYVFDGVNVYPPKDGEKLLRQWDNPIVVVHAPNVRNQVRFIYKNRNYIGWLILFFHGHEVLIEDRIYPKPYSFNKIELRKYRAAYFYDRVKIPIMRWFIKWSMKRGADLVFVSRWMLDETVKTTGLPLKCNDHVHIINNGLNSFIKESSYKLGDVKADFITIRPFDKSKYSVDLVVELAKANPQYKFHIYGKGEYFNHHEKPDNVEIINEFLLPKDMPGVFNQYRCALMPTKADAQGLMMCEMAVHGMPMITSDIAVCHEMLDEYSNVVYINNNNFSKHIEKLPEPLSASVNRFNYESTIGKEIEIIKKRMG